MNDNHSSEGVYQATTFPLLEAVLGRRSRRFFRGAHIPDGVFTYKSKHSITPLSSEEKSFLLTACCSNTSWNHLIYRAQRYAPYLSNYAGSAAGRTFPSAAGFHTTVTFFTDDTGVYVVDNRDSNHITERDDTGVLELEILFEKLDESTRKLQDQRLELPQQTPFIEAHNTWVVNKPGSLLVIPVADLSQHVLLNLCYMLQNGLVLYDDINRTSIPGLEQFSAIVDPTNVWPLSFVEQSSLAEVATEISTSCYTGALFLQAMGLGGWMFDGIDPLSILGASGDPSVPGLRFRYQSESHFSYPNVVGLDGVMEGYGPPYHSSMRSAVEKIYMRKFGPGGPFNPETPGPWKDSRLVRSSAQPYSREFIECITLQAQYILDTFGKFPGTVPSIFVHTYLQAHHLDTEFYDLFYKPGAYLSTHKHHMEKWHGA